MDAIIFPEMTQLINRTLIKVSKKGVPIANEWHSEIPSGPCEENELVEEVKRHANVIVNATMDEVVAYNRIVLQVIQSLTVTDPSYTLNSVDLQLRGPPQPPATLVMLEHLGLDSIQPNRIKWFLQPISSFGCLRSLIVTNTFIDRESALLLWKVFPQLEVLALMDVHFLDMTAVRENMKGMLCPRLKKLYLHYSDGGFPMEDQYQLLLACPSLEAFHWAFPKGDEDHMFSSEFMEIRESSDAEMYREVKEVHIVGSMNDYGIALAMNNMPGIRSLSICIDNQIGPLSLVAMTNLAANLTRFESHSPLTNSASVRLVLFSCPMLHTLIARKISAVDAIQDRQTQWPCACSLKVLCLSFAFESHETHLQDEVYMKLAECTQLEQLIMHEPCNESPGSFGLRLRLAQGLGRLSSLSSMSFLSTLDDFTQTPRMEEVKWMELYWPKLHRYHCAYSGFSMVHQ
ncbi:hypothetical protein BGZ70_004051 [Mortierella alpina]|uniref:FBD domain-containing protein n=1 Tax=Mortierella alpina TaxID=64518 RepID=A0A9P6IUI0_MORAP|nr:hypothetical protein BGZ70_004051 [Mortierella alpina]